MVDPGDRPAVGPHKVVEPADLVGPRAGDPDEVVEPVETTGKPTVLDAAALRGPGRADAVAPGGPAEAGVVGAVGGSLGALTGLALAPLWGVPGVVATAAVGAANGAFAGLRGIYPWRTARGVLALALDSTWALPTTAAALFAHGFAAARGEARYSAALSRRRSRHVYGRGFQPRKGFAITLGNVVSGAGDVSNPRRARLITDHENVHVWQARWLGPLYPAVYGACAATGAAIGALAWLARRRRPDAPTLGKMVETFGYYLNPLEYWAYSRDAHWPPSGMAPGVGPQRPVVRSLLDLGRSGR